jgi:hypothetical protein
MSPRTFIGVGLLASALAGCMGKIEQLPNDEFDDPTVAKACQVRTLPVQPLRRLSSTQYANVIRDLFGTQGDTVISGTLFPPTVIDRGFSNDAAANTVNTEQSNAIEDEATRIATLIVDEPQPYLRALLPGTLPATIDDAAVDGAIDAFIADFGRRAYRHPLSADETSRVRGLYDAMRAEQGATKAFAAVVQFFVQSPQLLYRIEHGTGDGPVPELAKLTHYEMASRLSFLFLDSVPDADLYAAAERGELATKQQVAEQARRLASDPRFAAVLSRFHADWLHIYELTTKDAALYPSYTPAVRASLANEVGELTRLVFDAGGTIEDVLSTPRLPVDGTLASYYGVNGPASGWGTAEIPGRRGILTLGSVLAALANTSASSPIHRGNFFYKEVLCRPAISLPPASLDLMGPLQSTADLPTARERYAPLMTNSMCMGCHQKFNPIGFAFENFDAAGRFRAQENGTTIDASGTIDIGPEGAPNIVTFANASELVAHIGPTELAQDCYAKQWFRASNGRLDTEEDTCSAAQLKYLVSATAGDLRELMVALTQVDAFLYRRKVVE